MRGDSPSGLLVGENLSSNNTTDDNNDSFETADNDIRGLTTNQKMEFRPVCGDSPGQLHAGENLLTNNHTQPEAEFSQGSVIPKKPSDSYWNL